MKKGLVILLLLSLLLFLNTYTASAEEVSNIIQPDIELMTPTPPPREIKIECSPLGKIVKVGDTLTLKVILINFLETDVCHYIWQYSTDTVTWNDVPNSDTSVYTFAISTENYRYYWRVKVLYGM